MMVFNKNLLILLHLSMLVGKFILTQSIEQSHRRKLLSSFGETNFSVTEGYCIENPEESQVLVSKSHKSASLSCK